jgi:hypothetical protein
MDTSFETVIREPALYKLLTFHVPNLMSISRRLGRLSKESVQVRGSLLRFVTSLLFTERVLAQRPTPNMEDYPLFLSAAANSIYSQLTSIAGGRLSIRNPKTRPTVVTRGPTSYGCLYTKLYILKIQDYY